MSSSITKPFICRTCKTNLLPRTRPPITALTRTQPILFVARHASTTTTPTPPPNRIPVLEKPERFNPPSHGRRIPGRHTSRHYEPPLSQAQAEAQKTKKYPNSMPPPGSFMHWFLTTRSIHVWIIMSTLTSLALFTFITDFKRSTPYADLLPQYSFYSAPIEFLKQWGHVYKMHTEYISAETAARRQKKIEDVKKRGRYRKAHGLDKQEGFGGWMAKLDDDEEEQEAAAAGGVVVGDAGVEGKGKETLGVEDVVRGDVRGRKVVAEPVSVGTLGADGQALLAGTEDVQERRRAPPKRWLGIW
ncbi:hypothetical protein MMC25_006760 [Agyrium rufum]|nr:hypothetical protein [Agyrium rufum]